MKGGNQILYARPMGMALLITQFADCLSPAHFDAINLKGNDHFLLDQLFADLIVPHLHFHAPVELPPLFSRIVGNRPAVTEPFIGNGFGRKVQGALAIFGSGARPFTRQPHIVAVLLYQVPPERQGIGMTYKVESHIGAIAHAVEHFV